MQFSHPAGDASRDCWISQFQGCECSRREELLHSAVGECPVKSRSETVFGTQDVEYPEFFRSRDKSVRARPIHSKDQGDRVFFRSEGRRVVRI